MKVPNSLTKHLNKESSQKTNLNVSGTSGITNNSGERDFNEIEKMIKTKVDDSSSVLSKQFQQNIESSIISNLDGWIGNVSQEDSKVFEENFEEIKNSKKTTDSDGKKFMKKLTASKSLINSLNSIQTVKFKTSKISELSVQQNSNSKLVVGKMLDTSNKKVKLEITKNATLTSSTSKCLNINPEIPKVENKIKTTCLKLDFLKGDEDYSEVLDETLEIEDKISKIALRDNILSYNNDEFSMKNTSMKNNEVFSNSFLDQNINSKDIRDNVSPDKEYLFNKECNQNNFCFSKIKGIPTENIPKSTTNVNISKAFNFQSFKDNNNSTNTKNSNYTNYTSNCSINLANESMISNNNDNCSQIKTPKHQKKTSEPSLRNQTENSTSNTSLTKNNKHNGTEKLSLDSKYFTPTSNLKNNGSKLDINSAEYIVKPKNLTGMISGQNNNIIDSNIKMNVGSGYTTYIPSYSNQNSSIPYKKEQIFEGKSIVLENVMNGKDKRTTIMIRNVPLKYNIQNIADELNVIFAGRIDFINMPINTDTKLNLGYAFVNFTDPLHIVLFYETFQDRLWAKFKSDKKISINYAEKQGKKEITLKDDSLYFTSQDPKVSAKLKTANVEIPQKYYEIFKKLNPNSDISLPFSNSKNKGFSSFIVKKLC